MIPLHGDFKGPANQTACRRHGRSGILKVFFRRAPECFDTNALPAVRDRDPFESPGLTYACDRTPSKAIDDVARGALILAGSGMCPGGRGLHPL